MAETKSPTDIEEPATVPVHEEALDQNPPAWEQIEKGRFRPRRIRGSFLGRELG